MKIAICAALYEAGRPFLAGFTEALCAAAAEGGVAREVVFIAAVDGLLDAEEALANLAEHLDIDTVDIPAGHTPAGVRRAMLAAGQASGADVLVFIDMDDLIAPGALESHLGALREADFSYGDMDLIDVSGRGLGRRFFDGAGVPGHIDNIAAISDRNFLGFSNTAVRTSRIAPVALAVPEDVIAADWWFYTMLLLGGLSGRKTAGPVAAYRIHDANTLGAGTPRTVTGAIGQTEAMLRHYRAFSAHPALGARAEQTEQVLAKLRNAPERELAEHLGVWGNDGGAWFEGIARIAENLSAAPLADTVSR